MTKRNPSPSPVPATPALFARAATAVPSTWNEADRSVEVIWSTGGDVQRYAYDVGTFVERLSMEPSAVRLGRLNAGAPVLDTHNRFNLDGVVGSVVPGSVQIVGGQGVARIRLSDTPDAADVVAKVAAGHIRNISVGYAVHDYEDQPAADGGLPVRLAVDWEPMEVSLVPISADAGAHIRSYPGLAAPSPAPRAGGITIQEIRRRCAAAGLADADALDLTERHLEAPLSGDELMNEIGHRFAATDSPARTISRVSVTRDYGETARQGVEDAIFCRMANRRPEGPGQQFIGLSLRDMARELLSPRAGGRGLSDMELQERAMHSTSDFAGVLVGAGNRWLLEQFQAAESAIKRASRERGAEDFRTITAARLSGSPELLNVNEGGEVKHGPIFDQAETYRMATFARIFGLTRQLLINDDLSAFSDPLRLMARAAAECEARELAALLNDGSGTGPVMADGNRLFSLAHFNIADTGEALSVPTLGVARAFMRNQRDNDEGATPINAVPRFLMVAPAQETIAEQLLATLTPNQVDEVNPFGGRLELLVDPRLEGVRWRLFADPVAFPVLEHAYLNSARGPQLSMRDGFDVLGMQFRVFLDFGCGAVDWRGAFLNPGA